MTAPKTEDCPGIDFLYTILSSVDVFLNGGLMVEHWLSIKQVVRVIN